MKNRRALEDVITRFSEQLLAAGTASIAETLASRSMRRTAVPKPVRRRMPAPAARVLAGLPGEAEVGTRIVRTLEVGMGNSFSAAEIAERLRADPDEVRTASDRLKKAGRLRQDRAKYRLP